jgi:hypothetical protein
VGAWVAAAWCRDDCHTPTSAGLAKSFSLWTAWSTKASALSRPPASAVGSTPEIAHVLIRPVHCIRSLLFDNHVSSDDQLLAAVKTNVSATVPFSMCVIEISGDAFMQMYAFTFSSVQLSLCLQEVRLADTRRQKLKTIYEQGISPSNGQLTGMEAKESFVVTPLYG